MGQMAELNRLQVDWTAFEDVADDRKQNADIYLSLDGMAGNWRGKPGAGSDGKHGGVREWKLECGLFPVDPKVCLGCSLPACAYEGHGACPYVKALLNGQAQRQRERVKARYQTAPEYRKRVIARSTANAARNGRDTQGREIRLDSLMTKREKLEAEQAALRTQLLSKRYAHRKGREATV